MAQRGMSPPRLVAWEVTAACNLSCPHCRVEGRRSGDGGDGELSEAEGAKLIEQLAAAGVSSLILTGGEPLLRADVFDLARAGCRAGLRVLLATNGLPLSRGRAAEALASGVARISVSLDGATAPSHDRLRGDGAFDGALAGIGAARAAGLPVQVGTTVMRANLAELAATNELAARLGACGHNLFLFVPTGCGASLAQERLSAEEYADALREVERVCRASLVPMRVTCAPELALRLPGVASECIAGSGFGFVSASGRLQPCGYMPVDCGSVRGQPFSELWRSSLQLERLRGAPRATCLARGRVEAGVG